MSGEATTPPARRKRDSYDDIEPLFQQLAALDPDDPQRRVLRETIISRCLPVAEHIARKFSGRGESFEDLLQIARVGLIAAVDRFDPQYGATFLGYAVPTIMGEVRRHFRDYTWAVRVPRRLKEIHVKLGPVTDTLTHRLGRAPNAREIAEELGVDMAEVTQALIARNGYQASSLDAAEEGDDGSAAGSSLLDALGAEEPQFETVDDYLAVKPLLAALSDHERRILSMRFYRSMTQQQIADQLGCSQMHVSRLLSKTLKKLREQATQD
ncbi:RNA polymerase sigma factor SigF [Nocardia blacklockiae]|uniref:RNA polymerase sigma factor SigF n=1 Tax=Nocardia blacklockiae TaxID=480036 RepID=UPI0018942721|nr:RNA polymerase sigma factor SigF [Nocardia blacklockiae]MBF6171867.1 RNA polymerase sigma factor SigF [Nocardia blacklockiae]